MYYTSMHNYLYRKTVDACAYYDNRNLLLGRAWMVAKYLKKNILVSIIVIWYYDPSVQIITSQISKIINFFHTLFYTETIHNRLTQNALNIHTSCSIHNAYYYHVYTAAGCLWV